MKNQTVKKLPYLDAGFIPDEKRYAESLSEFIKFKTISDKRFFDKKEFDKFREYIIGRYPLVFEKGELSCFDGGIMVKLEGRKHDAPLVLMSHYDVVPENGKWTKDAFSGEITDETVWGRGAVDTKGSLCAIFESAEGLLSEGFELRQDLYILSSSKEEIAGDDVVDMVKWFKEKGVKPCLVIDEGGGIVDPPVPGVQGKFAMIGMVERSSARLVLEAVSGKNGTGMEQLSRFILEMSGRKLGFRDFTPENRAMFEAMRPNMNAPMRFIFSNLWLFKGLLIKLLPKVNKAAAGLFGATAAFSPPKDEEVLDIPSNAARMVARLSSNYYNKIDDIISEFTQIAEAKGLKVTVLSKRETPPPEPLNSDGFSFTADAIRTVFEGVTPSPFSVLGGTDARHFIGTADSVIRFAPIYMNKQQFGSFHNTDENLNISSLTGAVRFYREILKRF